MLNMTLWRRMFADGMIQLIASVVVLFAFSWISVWMVSLLNIDQVRIILEQLPSDWEELSPVPWEQVVTYSGRIGVFYEHPVIVLVVLAWAIGRGSDVVSGFLGRGTMEMLLAQPVSRLQLLLTHSTVTFVGLVILVGFTWLGTYTGICTTQIEVRRTARITIPVVGVKIPVPYTQTEPEMVPMSKEVDPADFVPAAVNLGALGFFLSGLAALMSSWDRYRWRTIGIVAGFVLVSLIIEVVSLSTKDLAWMQSLTVMSAFEPQLFVSVAAYHPEQTWDIFQTTTETVQAIAGSDMQETEKITGLGPLGCNLVLFGLGCLGYIASAVIFSRRDLPAPI